MQFAVTAMDHRDPGAHQRRLDAREKHLARVRLMIIDGSFLSGGAILDTGGKMVGSSMHLQFESREALNTWLSTDPYITGHVWETVHIREVKLVPVRDLMKEA